LGNDTKQQATIIKETMEDTYAQFKISAGSDVILGGGTEDNENYFANVAYYPYGDNVTVAKDGDNYIVSAVFPAEQSFKDGSFGTNVYPMVAVSDGLNFGFRNVAGMIHIPLKGTATITKVTVESKSHKLAGNYKVTASANAAPTMEMASDATNVITLSCGEEGVTLNENTALGFDFVLPVGTYEGGDLTFTFYDKNNSSMEFVAANDDKVERSKRTMFSERLYRNDLGYEKVGENEYNVFNADGFVSVFNNITPNRVINIKDDLDMAGKTIDATNGNVGFTLNGNGFTISNLEGVEQGLFVNNSGSSIYKFYKVKLEGCSVNSTTNYGALFVGDADTCDELVIEGCEVNNCTVSSGKYAAAFVAYTAGYNDPNDGPVYSDITIKDCKVVGGSITGGGSTAAAIGHAGGNPDTDNIVTNLTVSGVAINGEDAAHTGIVVGTANVGKTIITNIVNENVTGNYNANHPLYGRFVPNSTGKLAIDGVNVVSTANDLYSLATAATGEVKIALANDITLGNETGACDAVNFINATSVTIDGGNNKIIFKGKAQHERDTSIEKVAGILSAGNITVKNVTLVNEKLSYNGTTSSADRIQVYTTIRGNSVTYENVTFDGGVQVKGNETFRGCSFTETVLTADADGYAKDGRFCMFIDHEYDATGTFEVTLDGCTFNASGYGCVKVSGDDGAYITVNVKDCSFTNTCPSNSWSKTTPKFDIKKTGANITVNDQGGNTWSTGNNRGIGEG